MERASGRGSGSERENYTHGTANVSQSYAVRAMTLNEFVKLNFNRFDFIGILIEITLKGILVCDTRVTLFFLLLLLLTLFLSLHSLFISLI